MPVVPKGGASCTARSPRSEGCSKGEPEEAVTMSSSVTAPVVVGYDGSPASAAALRWAGAYADHTGAAVRGVHALALPLVRGPAGFTSVVRVVHLIASAEGFLAQACGTLPA